MKKNNNIYSRFKEGDKVVVVKSYLSFGNYKIHDHRTAVIKSIEIFGNNIKLNITMDDDGVVTAIPEENVERVR